MEQDEAKEQPSEQVEQVAPGLPPAPEPTETERLQAVLEESERERGQFKSLAQRVQADFANYRRRSEEEQAEHKRSANAQLLLQLLPVLDDLERALEHQPTGASKTEVGWLEGVRLIAHKFKTLLEEVGLERIEALGRPFDPWEHEVLSYEETSESADGEVLALIREGYRLHGRVLRPAMVKVAKAPPEPAKGELGPTETEQTA